MSATILPSGHTLTSTPKPHFLDRLARRAVLARLAGLRNGGLTLVEGTRSHRYGDADKGSDVTITVLDPRFFTEIAFGGSIGAGEAYMAGYWTCSDLTGAIRLFARNMDLLDAMEGGWGRLTTPLHKGFHWLHRNTRGGAQRNIAAHYDIGNDLFRLFLDETMMYSSAIYASPESGLHDAQLAKLDRICRKLQLSPADHVLEIGTGWGGFAIHAAGRYGCRVTTTTISQNQYQLALERIRAAGLEHRVTVLLKDYRDLEGTFDKIVSIEMIEAVGHEYYGDYFSRCSALLKPEGMMLLQGITIADHRYERARRSVDFIQRYVFPGSCIPSVAALCSAIARCSDLRLFHLEDIGPHYATTLRQWRERFFARLDAVRRLGYTDTFIRMWEFYLCYCEGGFAERTIGDVHMLLTKPGCRREPLLPVL